MTGGNQYKGASNYGRETQGEGAIGREETNIKERAIELKQFKGDTLSTLVDASIAIEKIRVSAQIRQSHLRKQNKADPETGELCHRLTGLEDYVNGRIAELLENHPEGLEGV